MGKTVAAALMILAVPRLGAAVCVVTNTPSTNLTIVGNSSTQVLQITDLGTSVVVSLDCNNNGSFLDATAGDLNAVAYVGVQTINLQMGGRDTVTYTQGAAFTGVVRDLLVQLGPGLGANTLTVTGGYPILGHSSVVVDVAGGGNADTVTIDFSGSAVDSSAVLLYADLGPGSDSLTIREPAATNARVDADVELGPGNNAMQLVADQPVSGSTLRADIGGSDSSIDIDRVTTRFAASFDAASRAWVATNLRTGDDVYLGTFDLGAFKVLNGSEVRFRVNGGSGKDSLSIGDGNTIGPAQIDGLAEFILRGGPGSDSMSFGWDGVTGSGTFRVRESGGTFDDAVFSAIAADPGSVNTLDVAVQGGRGTDIVYSAVFDPGGGVSYGTLGTTILDGGFDTDRCVPFGDGAILTLGCEPNP